MNTAHKVMSNMADVVSKRVLSIQSHVVSGYVGNKAATFPLQVLGYDVDAVNSVQFSNHTGYKHIRGQVLQDSELKTLFEGLKLNNIHRYSHLLTGYCGSESFLREIINVLKQMKEANPGLTFVCDPVLGDHGKYYVPESLLPIYRDELLPHSDIITPNQFEAELLSGMKIDVESDAIKAIARLLQKGPKAIVLTSGCYGNENNLTLLAADKNNPREYIRMEIEKLDGIFTGTGDLFSSLFLAWYDTYSNDIKTACEYTLSSLQKVLHRTIAHSQKVNDTGVPSTAAHRELQLVQSLDIIRCPDDLLTAEVVQTDLLG